MHHVTLKLNYFTNHCLDFSRNEKDFFLTKLCFIIRSGYEMIFNLKIKFSQGIRIY